MTSAPKRPVGHLGQGQPQSLRTAQAQNPCDSKGRNIPEHALKVGQNRLPRDGLIMIMMSIGKVLWNGRMCGPLGGHTTKSIVYDECDRVRRKSDCPIMIALSFCALSARLASSMAPRLLRVLVCIVIWDLQAKP